MSTIFSQITGDVVQEECRSPLRLVLRTPKPPTTPSNIPGQNPVRTETPVHQRHHSLGDSLEPSSPYKSRFNHRNTAPASRIDHNPDLFTHNISVVPRSHFTPLVPPQPALEWISKDPTALSRCKSGSLTGTAASGDSYNHRPWEQWSIPWRKGKDGASATTVSDGFRPYETRLLGLNSQCSSHEDMSKCTPRSKPTETQNEQSSTIESSKAARAQADTTVFMDAQFQPLMIWQTPQAAAVQQSHACGLPSSKRNCGAVYETEVEALLSSAHSTPRTTSRASFPPHGLEVHRDCLPKLQRTLKDLAVSQNQFRDMKHRLRVLEEALERQMSHNSRLEADIRTFQKHMVRDINDSRWANDQDREVATCLSRLHSQVKKVAKTLAFSRSADLLEKLKQGPTNPTTARYFGQFWHLNDHDLVSSFTYIAAKSRCASKFLVQACLSHEITTQILKEPFFLFMQSRLAMNDIYQRLLKVDEKAAHQWRGQQLRLLDPASNNPSLCMSADEFSTSGKWRREVCEQYVQSFLNGPGHVLFDFTNTAGEQTTNPSDASITKHEEIRRALLDLFTYAAEISYKMWMQRTNYQFCLFEDVQKSSFDLDSTKRKPQASPKNGDEVKLEQLRPRVPLLVTFPGTFASGSDTGEGYEWKRVLNRAVVWFDD